MAILQIFSEKIFTNGSDSVNLAKIAYDCRFFIRDFGADGCLRRAPGEGRERFMRMSGGHSKASRKRVTPLSKGLAQGDWGLIKVDFAEILNGSSTNPLVQSIMNSSDLR